MTAVLPTVTMQVGSGMVVPTEINLPDASKIYPDASGHIACPSPFVTTLISAGWQIV